MFIMLCLCHNTCSHFCLLIVAFPSPHPFLLSTETDSPLDRLIDQSSDSSSSLLAPTMAKKKGPKIGRGGGGRNNSKAARPRSNDGGGAAPTSVSATSHQLPPPESPSLPKSIGKPSSEDLSLLPSQDSSPSKKNTKHIQQPTCRQKK